VRAGLVAILVICACGTVSHAGQRGSGARALDRSDAVVRFGIWFNAVRDYRPAELDPPALQIAAWPPQALDDLFVELATLRALMRDPDRSVFLMPEGSTKGIPPAAYYDARALNRMRDLAMAAQANGATDIDLIERASLLHTDLAFHPEILSATTLGPNSTGPSRGVIQFGDGRQTALDQSVDHLNVARRLLALVPRGNTHDADIRRWYQATAAHEQAVLFWDVAHVDDAVTQFPDAPELQFLAGCLHENVAAPAVRVVVEQARLPSGTRMLVSGQRDELRKAAAAFKRAVDLRPDFVEARLHYGHVQALLGQWNDAVVTLRGLPEAAPSPALKYIASMFYGDAAEGASRIDDARTAYARAAALFPSAQPPRLALSHLAWQTGERTVAGEQLDTMFTQAAVADPDVDPMLAYASLQGREADAWLADSRQRFAQPGPPLTP
jgi:tetratricopeptide (TPR) repeat protein